MSHYGNFINENENENCDAKMTIPTMSFTFLNLHLGHLADAFIQSDLQRVPFTI